MSNLFIIPDVIYIPLLLCSWLAALFSGIAFVYSLFMKKAKKGMLFWAGIFALSLLVVFLLMNGFIAAASMMD